MVSKALKFVSVIFAILWMVIIFAEYWMYNPNYDKALQLFEYLDLLILLVVLGSGVSWYILKKRKTPIGFLNGSTILLGLLFIDIIAVNRFCSKIKGIDFDIAGVFSHLAHIIGVVICLYLIYLLVRILGSLFTTVFPLKISNTDLPLLQTAIGIMILVFLLFFLGLIGALNGFVLIPICLLIMAFYWRHTYQITKDTFLTPIKIPTQLNVVGIFSFLFLGTFLILNFVQILRPFPIGADSLRVYVNLPTLLAEYGGLVEGNQPYNWSLFMSLGKVIFGRIDVVLGLSFMGGLLSLLALYRLSRKWLDVNFSALVLLLFYSIPMISFLSYMDMKIDMGLMFITLCVLLLFYNWAQPSPSEGSKKDVKGPGLEKANTFFKNRIPQVVKKNRLLVLMGLLIGFAFGIKVTVLFFLLALLSSIWFLKGNKLTFITSCVVCFATVFILELDVQAALRQFHKDVYILEWGLLIAGLGLLTYLFFKQKAKLMELMTYSLVIGSFFILPTLPWMIKNFSETGKIDSISLLHGKKATPEIKFSRANLKAKKGEIIIPGVYQLPEKETPKQKDKGGENEAVSADLHRFIGYEVLPVRYLSIPYDVFVKTNISGFFTDVGFVLFLLFPLLYLFQRRKDSDWRDIVANVSFIFMSILLLLISIPSTFLSKNNLSTLESGLAKLNSGTSSGILNDVSNFSNKTFLPLYQPIYEWMQSLSKDGGGITYPLLLLVFIGIILMIFNRIKAHSKITQSIVIFLSMYLFLWWVLGSGAPWYGILLFALPFIFLMKSVAPQDEENDENQNEWIGAIRKYAVLSIAVIWVFLAFVHRTTNYEPTDDARAKNLYYPAIMNYQLGNYNENKVMDNHFPNVRTLVQPINKDKRALVYMVGSPYKYFIDKNDSRVLSDTYLDLFDELISKFETKENIIKALKDRGFKYIIFDLNMFSYDVTPGKTLTRKFIQLNNTLYNNPGVELMATDRKIKLYSTGEEVFDIFQDKGSIVKSGSIAIFKIK